MEKKKTNWRYILILTVFFIIQLLIVTRFGRYLYGSTTDWDSQHVRIPEYFRNLFYSTGDLFPDFAPNIGGGQNIYFMSYYGLFNPVIMLSYLMPFVPMRYYIIFSTVLLVYISTLLLYRWLLGHFTDKSSAVTAMMFILASPMLFHTHRHIMFINYMPFLILGLMGVDEYFLRGKRWIIAISVCLVCLMSYFFSIGAIAALVIYGIYRYIKQTERITVKGFLVDGFKFLLPVLLGILMAAFLLVPTFIALLSGRAEGEAQAFNFLSLFIPTLQQYNILHSTYSLGLNSTAVFSLFYLIIKLKREKRFLGIMLALIPVFPVFIFFLNGMMYVNSKVMIPFLPIYMYAIAICIRDMFFAKKADWNCIKIFSAFALIIIILNIRSINIILDYSITIISLVLFNLKRKRRFLVVSATIVSLVTFCLAQLSDTLVDPTVFDAYKKSDGLIKYAIETDSSVYRINDRTGGLPVANRIVSSRHYVSSIYSSLSNQHYVDFYYNSIGNEIRNRSRGQLSNPFNLVFDLYMGNKYTVKKDLNMPGYTKIKTDENGLSLYKNEDVLPVAYFSDRVMPLSQFEKLSYPYDAEALLNYVIVKDAPECEYETVITPFEGFDYKIVKKENLEVTKSGDTITVNSEDNGNLKIDLNSDLTNSILFIEFTLDSNNSSKIGDNHISINGNVNKLSYAGWKYHNNNYVFQYTVAENTIDTLNIKFKKGEYVIKDIKLFTADYDAFVSKTCAVCPLELDKVATKGDVIAGKVNAPSDGYFNLSVPYDKGFKLYVDGERTDFEMTDTAFVGFKMEKGEHDISIVYAAPGANISKIVSFTALLGFVILVCLETKGYKEPDKK
ncbi:MAG: YfhO family protein [Clostridia bacterium]|nr:YfhO family protein [Clostridia bacterium]